MSQLQGAGPLLCDLDGVVWLAESPIPGSVEALGRLSQADVPVLFITNSSFSTTGELENALELLGIAARGRVLTSARAAALLVEPDENVFVIGGGGLVEDITARGARVLPAHIDPDGPVDTVMVGLHRGFDYAMLSRASTAVRRGARLIGANSDATYPTPLGEVPGGGAILAAVERASGVTGLVAGKPHSPMASLVKEMLPGVDLTRAVMVGDRADTDGAFADRLGCRFAHVRTGVIPATDGAPGTHADLAAVVDALLG